MTIHEQAKSVGPPSDAALVAATLAGDREGYRWLVERYSQRLFRLAYRMTGNEHDAEDMVQETFLRAYRSLAKFEARANFATWLYRICINGSLDQRRKHKPLAHATALDDPDRAGRASELRSAHPTPERLLYSTEMGEHLARGMALLSPTERAAFAMRHHEGLSIEEISGVLGIRNAATKNTIFRGVQKLRRHLQPLLGGSPCNT